MPLSDPQPRELFHTRNIRMRGFRRADGLWDIEGHLVDTKTYDYVNTWSGPRYKGHPIHEMHIRLTVDDEMVVQDVEAATDHSPFPICGGGNDNFKRLRGVKIAAGWNRKVRELLGGPLACTHIREMLGPLGTVAYQTIRSYLRDVLSEDPDRFREGTRQAKVNSCWAYASDNEVVRDRMPEYYTGSRPAAGP